VPRQRTVYHSPFHSRLDFVAPNTDRRRRHACRSMRLTPAPRGLSGKDDRRRLHIYTWQAAASRSRQYTSRLQLRADWLPVPTLWLLACPALPIPTAAVTRCNVLNAFFYHYHCDNHTAHHHATHHTSGRNEGASLRRYLCFVSFMLMPTEEKDKRRYTIYYSISVAEPPMMSRHNCTLPRTHTRSTRPPFLLPHPTFPLLTVSLWDGYH